MSLELFVLGDLAQAGGPRRLVAVAGHRNFPEKPISYKRTARKHDDGSPSRSIANTRNTQVGDRVEDKVLSSVNSLWSSRFGVPGPEQTCTNGLVLLYQPLFLEAPI